MYAARSFWAAALTALLVLPNRSAPAQAPDSARTALKPVVVTATRAEFPAVTSAVTVISGEELERRGIDHVLDALRGVPGLAVVQTGSFGSATAVYGRGGESGYMRVLIDGTPVNDPGGEFDFAQLTTANVDRIEIVRGPASVLYGSDAVTGAIQVFTRRGRGTPRYAGSVRGGTYGTTAADLSYAGGVGDADFAAAISQFSTNGIHPFNGAYRNTGVSGTIGVQPDSSGEARLFFRHTSDRVGIPTDGTGAVVDRNAFQLFDRTTIGLRLRHAVGPRLTTRLAVSSHATDGGFDDAPDGPADTLGLFSYRDLAHTLRQSADARVDVLASTTVMVTAGATVEEQRYRNVSRSASQYGPSMDALTAARSTRGEYVQALHAGERVTWSAGLRHEENDSFGTFWTWRGGATFGIGRGSVVRATAGNAFREPTFYENYASGYARGNPALRPEQTQSWEIGLDQRLPGNLITFGSTWFDQSFRDLIEYTYATPSPTAPNFFNIAAARARGLELEAAAGDRGHAYVAATYTWLMTRVGAAGFDTSGTGYFRPGESLLRRPGRTWSVEVGRYLHRAGASTRWVSTGSRADIDYAAGQRVVMPPYGLLDVATHVVLYEPPEPEGSVSLTASVANALGTRYETVRGFRSPGRSVLVGVRLGRP
jgi:vitamin B12 transporter